MAAWSCHRERGQKPVIGVWQIAYDGSRTSPQGCTPPLVVRYQDNCTARKDSVNNFIRVLVSSIAFALLGLPAVLLSADANFFSGKTIRIVVGTSPGGG